MLKGFCLELKRVRWLQSTAELVLNTLLSKGLSKSATLCVRKTTVVYFSNIQDENIQQLNGNTILTK